MIARYATVDDPTIRGLGVQLLEPFEIGRRKRKAGEGSVESLK